MSVDSEKDYGSIIFLNDRKALLEWMNVYCTLAILSCFVNI